MAVLCVLLSCKKKNDDVVPVFVWPDGTGEYAPYTYGSTFVYEVRTNSPASIDSFTYTVAKDTLIDGLKFYKLQSSKPNLAGHLYCRYANGVRTEINYDSELAGGLNMPAIKATVLKINEAVNATWNNTLNITIPGLPNPVPVTFAYTLLQKGITKNVLQKDYPETLEVKSVTSITGILGMPPISFTANNFYGKNQGLVQQEDSDGSIKLKRSNIIK